jgi:hypothetical protein
VAHQRSVVGVPSDVSGQTANVERDLVQIKQGGVELRRGMFAEVLARGPDHLLVRALEWDDGRQVIVPAEDVVSPRRITDVTR